MNNISQFQRGSLPEQVGRFLLIYSKIFVENESSFCTFSLTQGSNSIFISFCCFTFWNPIPEFFFLTGYISWLFLSISSRHPLYFLKCKIEHNSLPFVQAEVLPALIKGEKYLFCLICPSLVSTFQSLACFYITAHSTTLCQARRMERQTYGWKPLP